MFGERAFIRGESSQIDDSFPSVRLRRIGEIRRALFLLAGEVAAGAHRVDQVIGGIDRLREIPQGRGIEEVRFDDVQPGFIVPRSWPRESAAGRGRRR